MSDDTPAAPPWATIKALFEQALELPADARAALVATAPLGEAERRELLSLLAHHAAAVEAPGFMAQPAAEALLGPAERLGQRLGPWRLAALLGSGGMGDVYEAERADGRFEGQVAIKLLRRGLDSAAVLQRFSQEQRSLARLHHPAIARLYDAGIGESGAPWFAMELVRGRPIDEACEGLPMAQRLALFLQLADAVAYAHRNLLVHRDLKPGNVLVTAEGQVKLLDFGIAKALDPREAGEHHGAAPDLTAGGAPPYTPRYASPEQVRGEPVSTSTDLYSLGVLLYVMLTGQRPYGRDATTPQAAARSVLEEDPTRPSSLTPSAAAAPGWLARRQHLRGDLDNILLKALEKQPDRRYPSVDAFTADLRAMLAGFPVSARPQGAAYHLSKFIARHRSIVLASSLAVLALAGGLATTAWQAHAAGLARDEARAARSVAERRLAAMREVTHDLVFRYGDSVEFLPRGADIKAALYRDTLRALERLGPDGGGDAGALADVAVTHARLAELLAEGFAGSLGQAAEARAHAERAIALTPQVWPVARLDARAANWLARAHDVKAAQLREAGELPQSLAVLQAGLALLDQALAVAADDTARLWLLGERSTLRTGVAMAYDNPGPNLGEPDRAAAYYQQAADDIDALMKLDPALDALDAASRPENIRARANFQFSQGVTLGMLSTTQVRRGDHAAAQQARARSVRALQSALAHDERQLPIRDALATANHQWALLSLSTGDNKAALAAATEGRAQAARLVAAEPDNATWRETLALGSQGLGSALLATERPAEALPVLDEAVAYWRAEVARDDRPGYRRLLALMSLRHGQALAATGQPVVGAAQVRSATAALAALSRAEPLAFDARLGWSEGAAWLAALPLEDAMWSRQACEALAEARAMRPLPPVAAGREAALCPA